MQEDGRDEDNALLASASGIIQCLSLLADEAATLKLHAAVCAIMEAMHTVAMESGAEAFTPFADMGEFADPVLLH